MGKFLHLKHKKKATFLEKENNTELIIYKSCLVRFINHGWRGEDFSVKLDLTWVRIRSNEKLL